MVKPVADLILDEAGNPVVVQHALTFDIPLISRSKYKRTVPKMADGGSLYNYEYDSYKPSPYMPKEYDFSTGLSDLTQKSLEDTEDWMRMYRPNTNQPITSEGPGDVGLDGTGSEGFGTDEGTTPNSLAGTISAVQGLPPGIMAMATMSPLTGVLGMFFGFLDHVDVAEEVDDSNTANTTQGHDPSLTGIPGLFGIHNRSEKSILADIKQAEQEVVADDKQAIANEPATLAENEAEQMAADEAAENSESSTSNDSSNDEGGIAGNLKSGGQIKGYQEGAMVEEQANTTMDTAGLGPMGLVDDMAGDQVTGVEDDLNLDTEEGAYVLNADAVELAGLKDLNQLVKDAIEIAIESDIPIPKSIDPTKKVPIKISNGEFVIPAILVPVIGLENLEKMNNRGLEYREKNREEEKAPPQEAQQQEAEQQDIPVEPSEVPSRGVPGEINLNKGGAIAEQMNRLM